MDKDSRTAKSARNARIALFFTIATFIVNFFSRRYFLGGLGSEILGMRVTLGTFLSMLTLSELGIGGGIGLYLYKPLLQKKYQEVNEILSLQGWAYNWAFAVFTLGMTVLVFFVPSIFADMQAPIEYVYLTLAVFYISTALSYTINYRTVIFFVDQRDYRPNIIVSTIAILKNLIQLIILQHIPNPYIYWIGIDLLSTLIAMCFQNHLVRKDYPWLKTDKRRGYQYYKKYPFVLSKTLQIFLYNVLVVLTYNTTPLIIYSVITLSTVAFYDNYKNLVTNLRTVIVSLFTNLSTGVASLIAEGDEERSHRFFWELLPLMYLVGAVGVFGLFNFASPTIRLWLGEQYIIDNLSLFLFSVVAYVEFTRMTIDAYLNGYKLYQDLWTPLAEAAILIGASIYLGTRYGLSGILMGQLLSMAIIIIWKPYNVYKNGFKRSVWTYWKGMLKLLLVGWSMIAVCSLLIKVLDLDTSTWMKLLVHAGWTSLLFLAGIWGVYYMISDGFRRMNKRLYLLLYGGIPLRIRGHLPEPHR